MRPRTQLVRVGFVLRPGRAPPRRGRSRARPAAAARRTAPGPAAGRRRWRRASRSPGPSRRPRRDGGSPRRPGGRAPRPSSSGVRRRLWAASSAATLGAPRRPARRAAASSSAAPWRVAVDGRQGEVAGPIVGVGDHARPGGRGERGGAAGSMSPRATEPSSGWAQRTSIASSSVSRPRSIASASLERIGAVAGTAWSRSGLAGPSAAAVCTTPGSPAGSPSSRADSVLSGLRDEAARRSRLQVGRAGELEGVHRVAARRARGSSSSAGRGIVATTGVSTWRIASMGSGPSMSSSVRSRRNSRRCRRAARCARSATQPDRPVLEAAQGVAQRARRDRVEPLQVVDRQHDRAARPSAGAACAGRPGHGRRGRCRDRARAGRGRSPRTGRAGRSACPGSSSSAGRATRTMWPASADPIERRPPDRRLPDAGRRRG